MFPLLYFWSDWVILVLRLALGAVFVVHGLPKIKDLKQTGINFHAMGFRPGIFWGPLVAVVESFGGLFFFFGLFTQFVAALIVGEFFVILIWKTGRGQPFAGNVELDLIIFASALILLALGGGSFSLDRLLYAQGFLGG